MVIINAGTNISVQKTLFTSQTISSDWVPAVRSGEGVVVLIFTALQADTFL